MSEKIKAKSFSYQTGSHPRRFVVIDANSLVHRAFHAFPATLSTSSGIQVNAVYGFTSMLLKVLSELKPKYLVCAFDMREPTFRHAEFIEYKAKRKPMDEGLAEQFPKVKEILSAFNVPVLEKKGFEADDILGTLAEQARTGKWKNEKVELIIVTGDKDLLQMVGGNVKVWLPHGSFKDLEMYDEATVVEQFGFEPELMPDYKGLRGDASDNIPGVKGIGEKTGADLIKQFGHIEGVYKNLDKVSERVRKLLESQMETALLSRKIATIVRDVDIDVRLEDCLMRDFDRDSVIGKFQEFEFRSLMKKIPESLSEKSEGKGKKAQQIGLFGFEAAEKSGIKPVRDFSDFNADEFIKDKRDQQLGLCYMGDVLCVAVKYPEKFELFNAKISEDSVKKLLRLLLNARSEVISMGWEDLCLALYKLNLSRQDKISLVEFAKTHLFDIGLASYYLSSGSRDYSLNAICLKYLAKLLPENTLDDQNFSVMCVDAMFMIAEKLKQEYQERSETTGSIRGATWGPIVTEWVRNVDMPLSLALAEMSEEGILVDVPKLRKKSVELEKETVLLQSKIYNHVGHEFNVSSSRQLADVLFNELKLEVQRRTKTGYSTSEDVLQKLVGHHPVVEEILKYREIMKIRSTYVDPLIEYAQSSKDGRVHTTFRQTITSTGRLSSINPNLQNIPVRSDLGKEIKSMFKASEGRVLVSADYSQIELRVMAHFSEDPLMLKDFERGADFHRVTAARILNKKEEDVTKDERRMAKTINFGVMYGLSSFGLSETLGISREDAAEYIGEYFEKYAGVKEFLEKTIAEVRKSGYAESLFGRRRYIGAINSRNRIARSASEREAINMPLQSTAADIMRIAMNRVYEWILECGLDVSFLLQIHDELVLECDKKDEKEVAMQLKKIMEDVVELKVPLECSVSAGRTLGEV